MESVSPSSFPRAVPLIAEGASSVAEAEGGFSDLLDFINPLQHIPVVSTLYRETTGDGISAAARIIGGGIFGGIPGLVASAADAVLEAATGQDAGGIAVSALKDVSSPTTSGGQKSSGHDGVPLISDRGQALVGMAMAMHAAPTSPAPVTTRKPPLPGDLSAYRAASLGLENEGKRTQLKGGLVETALKM